MTEPDTPGREPKVRARDNERPPRRLLSTAFQVILAAAVSVALFRVSVWVLDKSETLSRYFAQRVLWVLAFLPGVIAILNLIFGILPRRSRRKEELAPFFASQHAARTDGEVGDERAIL